MLKINEMVYVNTINESIHPCISRAIYWDNKAINPSMCEFKMSTPIGRVRSYTEYFNGSITYGVEVVTPPEKRSYLGESTIANFPAQYIKRIELLDSIKDYYETIPTIEFDPTVFRYELGTWVQHMVDLKWIGMIYGRTLDENNTARYKVRVTGGRTIDEYEIMFAKYDISREFDVKPVRKNSFKLYNEKRTSSQVVSTFDDEEE